MAATAAATGTMAGAMMATADTATAAATAAPVRHEAGTPRPRRLLDGLRMMFADRRSRAKRLELLGLDEHRLRDIGVPEAMLMAARGRCAAERRQRERDRLERLGW